MVAIRKKVGARGYIRTAPLSTGKKVYKIDCSVPVRDGIFDGELLSGFEQYFVQNIKLHGRKGKLADKVKVTLDKDTNVLAVSTTMKYRKNYFKYLSKKYLKKKDLRDYFRVIATGKTEYQLRYFNIQEQE
jgi:large subunit ribosomal protein L22e